MPSKLTLLSNKPRRPKPGTGFALLRLAGWTLKIVGLLLVGLALLGFISMLVKAGPELVETSQHLEQKMAGFIFFMLLGGLAVFLLLGLGGAALAGIGFAFGYWGTEPAVTGADGGLNPSPTAQVQEGQAKDPG